MKKDIYHKTKIIFLMGAALFISHVMIVYVFPTQAPTTINTRFVADLQADFEEYFDGLYGQRITPTLSPDRALAQLLNPTATPRLIENGGTLPEITPETGSDQVQAPTAVPEPTQPEPQPTISLEKPTPIPSPAVRLPTKAPTPDPELMYKSRVTELASAGYVEQGRGIFSKAAGTMYTYQYDDGVTFVEKRVQIGGKEYSGFVPVAAYAK